MTSPAPAIVWFRLDLRLADNPALHAAVEAGRPVVPLYIWSPDDEAPWQPGAATRWWLHHSLEALDASLQTQGSRIILRQGNPAEVLRSIARATGADAVFWNRRYEPTLRRRDAELEAALVSEGFDVRTFNSALLIEPEQIATKQGKPYQVFTPFYKASLVKAEGAEDHEFEVVDRPPAIAAPAKWPKSDALRSWKLVSPIPWADEFSSWAVPGEAAAQNRLQRFIECGGVMGYGEERDRPDHDGVSGLSVHLHFGELGPRQVRESLQLFARKGGLNAAAAAEKFLRQMYWREFAHHLLFHFPTTTDEPLRSQYADFAWKTDRKRLRAWQRGLTGYPIVDAGMRQLWQLGWMHNRVRMIVGSFLVKDLLISWREGAKWFWDTLVDADLANNTLGWQWIGGCGADAAPYFRVFNPTSQGEKFDPAGDYVRRYVPELAKLPAAWIHRPSEAPAEVLKAAGVVLGKNYPQPIVDHAAARDAALEAWRAIRTK
ncbi:MAG: DNA photolyase family protein [Planctomycetia bacterium]|nr:DNA photolyase family protein [Planctomycetia bacterium]